MQESGLTVHMAVLERDEAVIIEKVEAPGLVKLASWVGRRLDVNCTGVGKALMAYQSPEKLEYLFRTKDFARHNSHTIISKNALRRELTLVRQSGFALDNEEDEPGVRCIGAPVFDENSVAVAAISVAGTTSQIGMDRVPILSRQVMRAAHAVSSRMGYLPQSVVSRK
jgi:DNA-binding IclR family transcriptional regulator